jgi:hypothetical protein
MINDYAEMLSQANALRAALEEKLSDARQSVRQRDERIAALEAELLALREAKEEDDLNAKEEAIGYEL